MRIRHGALSIDVPEDWSDESTLLFVAPSPKLTIPGLHDQVPAREAVSLRFSRDPRPPRDLLHADVAQLRRLDPAFQVIAEGAIRAGLGEGWRLEQEVTVDGHKVRQLAAAFAVGPVRVVVNASSPAARFERARQQLEQVIQSLGLEG